MLKRILRFLCLLGGFVVLVHVLAHISVTIAPRDSDYHRISERRKFNSAIEEEGIEAISIGNSHAGAIDFRYFGVKGALLTRAGGDIFEINHILQVLVPRLKNLRIAFVSVSNYTFVTNNARSAGVSWRRSDLYRTLPGWKSIPGDEINFALGKAQLLLPIYDVIRSDSWEPVFSILISSKDQQSQVPTPEDPTKNTDCLNVPDELDEQAHARLRNIAALGTDKGLEGEIYQVLTEMVEYLEEERITTVFLTPPYWKEYNSEYARYAPEHIVLLKSHMQTIASDYGVPYIDLSSDPRFTNDATLFWDSNHLNQCGKESYARELIRILDQHEL